MLSVIKVPASNYNVRECSGLIHLAVHPDTTLRHNQRALETDDPQARVAEVAETSSRSIRKKSALLSASSRASKIKTYEPVSNRCSRRT